MRGIGILDVQLLLYIKKRIYSDRYEIRAYLLREPPPLFVFLTNDKNFINDAQEWFAKLEKPKAAKRGIKFERAHIHFRGSNGMPDARVHVFPILAGISEKQPQLLKKALKTLHDFLT